MRVFVAGATGAVGRPLVRRLVEAGHDVVGLTRREERATWLREQGARAAVGDALNAEWLSGAVQAAAPEVVIDQLTDLPQRLGLRGMRRFYRGQNALRARGSGALLAAAKRAGARRVVSQSVAFLYAPNGAGPKREEDPIWGDAPEPFGTTVRTEAAHDERVAGDPDVEGLVLRYGVFYGPGTQFAPGNGMHSDIRRRRLPIVGAGDGVWSFCHVEDAARAAVDALGGGGPGIYNVVDDDPAPTRVWIPEVARLIGAKPPRRVPYWVGRLVAGPAATAWTTRFPGAANGKARRELGWEPLYPSWRDGFRAEAAR